ncbi:hypothetical protein ACFPM0_28545 [Pseudonocardia sulfidoxydans]|uniref:hypothetical protein n=1 Tax=Pseudonocardia sulfidoxydans TaxID=54011 RepID=UPI00360DCF03
MRISSAGSSQGTMASVAGSTLRCTFPVSPAASSSRNFHQPTRCAASESGSGSVLSRMVRSSPSTPESPWWRATLSRTDNAMACSRSSAPSGTCQSCCETVAARSAASCASGRRPITSSVRARSPCRKRVAKGCDPACSSARRRSILCSPDSGRPRTMARCGLQIISGIHSAAGAPDRCQAASASAVSEADRLNSPR